MARQALVGVCVPQGPAARPDLAVSLPSSSMDGNHVNFLICDMFLGVQCTAIETTPVLWVQSQGFRADRWGV